MTTAPVILCLNSGSSSLKFALYQLGGGTDTALVEGAVERIGLPNGRLSVHAQTSGLSREELGAFHDHQAAVQAAFDSLEQLQLPTPEAVGHRIVHGGADHIAPEQVDARLLEDLRQLAPYAPLHLPAEIQGIEAVTARFPHLPQVACFDTAFHRRMPELAQRFPLPRAIWDAGVRRYGFHGLSYEYIIDEVGATALGRAVIAHLGNGASMAAILDGTSVDTTMGFSPVSGLVMGSRSGDLDPSVVIRLIQENKMPPPEVNALLNKQSGLLGVSGSSEDMRDLLDRESTEPHAADAIQIFCYSAKKYIGAYAAALGGLDTLVFTAGIGENAPRIRERICSGLDFLGFKIDAARNNANVPLISTDDSNVKVRVIKTNEDLMIARHTARLLSQQAKSETPDPARS